MTTYFCDHYGTNEVSYQEQETAVLQRQMLNNAMLARSKYIKQMLGQTEGRDLHKACGYPKTENIGPQDYRELFERNPVATRVVEVLPAETWKTTPVVFENEDESNTAFEESLLRVSADLSEGSKFKSEATNTLWSYLARADKLCGIGHYGTLFLGLDDNKDPSEPVEPKKGMRLTYLRVFDESGARVSKWVENANDPRNGKPEFYELRFTRPSGVGTEEVIEPRIVHWSRVIHLVDTLESSEVFAVPRMRPVYNRLLNLDTLFGASTEGYWNGAINMYAFNTHPQLGPIGVDTEAITQQMEEMLSGARRIVTGSGGSFSNLLPASVDPTSYIEKQLEAICIYLGIPKRKFMGSERGELASTQDEGDWKDTLTFRQDRIVTPNIIVPTIDRLIQHGVLEEPTEYGVRWDELDPMTRMERAQYARLVVETLAKFIQGDVNLVMHEGDFFEKILGLTEDEVTSILKEAQGIPEDDGQDEELIEEPQVVGKTEVA